MNKRILAALLAAILMLACGCWAEEEIEYPWCDFELDAFGGMMNIRYADGTAEETGGWSFSTEINRDGMTLGDVLAGFDIAGIEIIAEDDVFEGWLAFRTEEIIDEEGDFCGYDYILTNDAPITTEELMARPAEEGYSAFAAKWASIPAEEYYAQDMEDDYEMIYMPSVTLYANGGMFLHDGEEEDYEYDISASTVEPGQSVAEVVELDKIISITREGYEFDGWTVYDVAWMETVEGMPETDGQPCFEVFTNWYCVLWDYSVIGENMSTDEIRNLECGDGDLFIMANWK